MMVDVEKIQIQLKDGSVKEFTTGTTLLEIADALSSGLKKNAVVGKVNGKLVDLTTKVDQDAQVELFTYEDAEGLDTLRHSCAHLMAQAVARLWPEVKFAIGPVIDDGFYYDFSGRTFYPEDFAAIEQEMAKIVKADLPITRREISRAEALAMFAEREDRFKVEIINDLPENEVLSIYTQGEFTDLCTGPHLPSTGRMRAFKLLSVAGAYWRGNSDNEMLQRVYATAWPNQAQLEQYLFRIEEAKRRDHRKLGRELGLFTMREESPAMPFWLPKGRQIWKSLYEWSTKTQQRLGYEEISTPQVMKVDLYHQSGHYEFYKENMYFINQEGTEYGLKPMNCPAHCLVFSEGVHSYRDLPIRYSEYERLHRWEASGAVHGLMRVRGLCQDDAHIFCTQEQIEQEIMGVLRLLDQTYSTLGLKYKVKLSTRPDEYMGELEVWNKAEATLEHTLKAMAADYIINPADGAFYGPKLDFDVTDSLGRTWQCATLQLDFQTPMRFDLSYVDRDGGHKRPIMIHRAIFGSLERFIGILIEHFAGAFPTWLAPEQVRLLPIADRHVEYANELREKLLDLDIRATVDDAQEKIGYKIRNGQLQKVPYMLVIGDREMENGAIAVRSREAGDLGTKSVEEFIAEITREIQEKRLSKSHEGPTKA